MKATPRRRRQQDRQPKQRQAAASLGGAGRMAANAYVIAASKGRYRARAFGKRWYAQDAIAALFPTALPKHVDQSKLWRDVNKQLARDPEYRATGYGELDRMTVVRALNDLRAANADPRKVTI